MRISVIVVGSGPAESRREAASAWAADGDGLDLEVVEVGPTSQGEKGGAASALTWSSGDLLVLVADFIRPSPGAVARLAAGPFGEAILVPRARREPVNDGPTPPAGRLVDLDGRVLRELDIDQLRPAAEGYWEIPAPGVACLALSRKLYWKLWGLDPDLPLETALVDLALKSWLMGYPVWLDPAAEVIEAGMMPPVPADGLEQEARAFADHLQVARKAMDDREWAGWGEATRHESAGPVGSLARAMFRARSEPVERERTYLQAVRSRNGTWFAEYFGLDRPSLEAPPPPVADLMQVIGGAPPVELPHGWQEQPDVIRAHRHIARVVAASPPDYPEGRFHGRGIVICGGGQKYYPGAWVTIRMLRHLGCDLPIQLWHLGPHEVDERMESLVRPLGVEAVDAEVIRAEQPCRILRGWELKCYAILHSPFREVILLDADNHPLVDPAFLFDTPQFRQAGAIFWPDYNRLQPDRLAWEAFDVPYRYEPEFETGQIAVDKRACWAPLQMAMHYNEYSDFYYHHVWGDKETFHLAFRRLDAPYAMPTRSIHTLDACMCQHDFDGRRIFQHRNLDKWRLDGANRRIFGFEHEDLCHRFLAELRSLWIGKPYHNPAPNEREADAISRVAGQRFLYRRVGYDERKLRFEPGGKIGRGAAGCERHWSIDEVGGRLVLSILGESGVTCLLEREHDGDVWRGRWISFEKMPVELQKTA